MKYIIYLFATVCLLTGCGRKSFDEQVFEQAEEFTKTQCPRDVDAFTTIDSMTFDLQTRTLHYYYTLKDKLDDPQALTQSVVEDFEENMLVKLREDLGLKKEKEAELNFAYHYKSKKTGKPLLDINFTTEDYTGKINLHTFNYRETRNMREFTRANCPMRQDECTVLDSIWYDSIARTLYYDYSVSGILDDDSVYMDDAIKVRLRNQLIQSIKTNEEIAVERDKEKIDFAFRYFSSTTKKLRISETIKNKSLK